MEPNFPNITIRKKLYQTKNSTIWLIQSNDCKKDYSILKSIQKEGLSSNQADMVKRERKFYEENTLISFPRFIKAYQDTTNVYIGMTFIEGLNMSHLLKEKLMHFNKNNDNKDLFLYIIAQIIDMISLLHQQNYIYRDLKMNNLIIDKDLKCYLVDFGFVKKLDNTTGKTSTICGTLHMQAPEIFLTKLKKQSSYSYNVDIYALGVLIYEIFTGRPPFPYKCDNEMEYIENVIKGLTDDHFNNDFNEEGYNTDFKNNIIDLIKGCMKTNPDERYTINQIKDHKLFFTKDNNNNNNKGFEYYLLIGNKIDTKNGQAKNIIDSIAFDGEFSKDYDSTSLNDPFAMF